MLFGVAAGPCQAQATRTWVSGVGDDANPCSRTAPCKTFAGAISKTAAAGEISVLDPGGFGALTITKSISIVADGVEGGVLVSGTDGIKISAAATDVVFLKGLHIEGTGTGLNGIHVIQAADVYVTDTVIRGFKGAGGNGVFVDSTPTQSSIFLNNVQINATTNGVYVHSTGAKDKAFLDNCTIENVTSSSIQADTGTSTVFTSGSVFWNNPVSLSNGAQFVSTGNNYIAGATGPTTTTPLR